MQFVLTARSGVVKGASWHLGEGEWLVGRGSDCDVRVDDPLVSRRQCSLRVKRGTLQLDVVSGTVPTLVNGNPVHQCFLCSGDELAVGNAVLFVSQIEHEATSNVLAAVTDDTTRMLLGDVIPSDSFAETLISQEGPRTLTELASLYLLSRAFSQEIDEEKIVERLLGYCAAAFRGANALVMLGKYRSWGGSLRPADATLEASLQTEVDRAFEEGGASLCMSGANAPMAMIVAASFRGVVSAVIVVRGATNAHRFDESDLAHLSAAARIAAPFLSHSGLVSELEDKVAASQIAAVHLMGDSEALSRVRALLRRAAASPLPVLVQGETGSGKEVASRMIHSLSRQANGPFIAVNCAAISDQLFESEIFGHEKGAFTGAEARRRGYLERAHTGTLLLDEIADLSANNQARLLRVLESKTFNRVGGEDDIRADFRLICASNRDLLSLVGRGEFREDLYHRVAGVVIEMPSLRAHKEDIPLLAECFLEQVRPNLGRVVQGFAPSAVAWLRQQHWPGNVRELRATVARAAYLSDGEWITDADLELLETPAASGGASEPATLDEVERRHIRIVVAQFSGNVSAAARALGIHRNTLQKKLVELDESS